MIVICRVCVCLLVFAAVGRAAIAADISRLGIISVLGGTLDIVTHDVDTGTRLDRNQHQRIKVQPTDFELFALSVATESAKRSKVDPPLEVVQFERPNDGSIPWSIEGKFLVPTEGLRSVVVNAKASRLMIVQPVRAAALLKLDNGTVGSGYLEGIGFYIDTVFRVKRSDTGEIGTGFLAPFAYFEVVLVDTANWEVVSQRRVLASIVRSSARGKGGGFDPWQALDPRQKVAILRGLIRSELDKAVEECLR
jgi:hypothetical protein